MIKTSSLFRSSIVLGLGLGGFVDGILFHQVLGWHHLICSTATCQPESIAALQLQNRQDGLFHAVTWLLTVVGVWRVFRATQAAPQQPGRVLAGGALAGAGMFNLVEGLINHQILGLHHVRPESTHWLAWDLAFLASGVMLLTLGGLIARRRDGANNGRSGVPLSA